MMKKLLFMLFGLSLTLSPLQANERTEVEELGEEIPALAFFDAFKGNYHVIVAGTQAPKDENKNGSVSLDDAEGLFIFPYCHETGGVCDPGFRSFPLESTRVYRLKNEENHFVYTLETLEKGNLRQYKWEQRNQIIHFLDASYTLVSGEVFPLKFIIEKAPVFDPIPVEP